MVLYKEDLSDFDDMVTSSSISEASLLHNIVQRYQRNTIYVRPHRPHA
jgi:myosin heavy subunit